MLILPQQALNSWNKAFTRKDFPYSHLSVPGFPDLPVMSPTDQVSWHKARGKMKPLPTIGIDLQTFFMEFYIWSFSLSTWKMIFSNQIQIYFGKLQWFPKDVFFGNRKDSHSSLTKPLFSCQASWSVISTWILPTTPAEKNGTSSITTPNNVKSSFFGPRFRAFPAFFIQCQTCPTCPSHQQNLAKKSTGFLVDLKRSWIQFLASFLLRVFFAWKSKGPNPQGHVLQGTTGPTKGCFNLGWWAAWSLKFPSVFLRGLTSNQSDWHLGTGNHSSRMITNEVIPCGGAWEKLIKIAFFDLFWFRKHFLQNVRCPKSFKGFNQILVLSGWVVIKFATIDSAYLR